MSREQLVSRAREVAAAAGYPLHNRWGPASDETVLFIVDAVQSDSDDAAVSMRIGLANLCNEIQLCEPGCDWPAEEEFEAGVIAALRNLPLEGPA